jgi:hypothetical protein
LAVINESRLIWRQNEEGHFGLRTMHERAEQLGGQLHVRSAPGAGTCVVAGWVPLVNNGAGQQPGMQFDGLDHTNSLVPLWAKGDAGRLFREFAVNSDPVRGLHIDNTNIAAVRFRTLEPATK